MEGTSVDQVDGKSFVRNCFLKGRPGEMPIFDTATIPGQVIARLDGYAIIPMEEWRQLKQAAGEPVGEAR